MYYLLLYTAQKNVKEHFLIKSIASQLNSWDIDQLSSRRGC